MHTGNEHDLAPAPPGDEVPGHLLGGVKARRQRPSERPLEQHRVVLEKLTTAGKRRVRHQDIEPRQQFDCLANNASTRLAGEDVAWHKAGPHSQSANLLDDRAGQIGIVPIVDHHIGPGTGEFEGTPPANSLGGTGHQSSLAFQSHARHLESGRWNAPGLPLERTVRQQPVLGQAHESRSQEAESDLCPAAARGCLECRCFHPQCSACLAAGLAGQPALTGAGC